jgi:hypothetical protein
MSTLKVNNITDTSGGSTNLTVPNTAKAWVNFNGTGTVAIRAQYNVSSITDNGTGDYTVNFTTALADANYTAACTNGRGSRVLAHHDQITTQTASAYRFTVSDTPNSSVVALAFTDVSVLMLSFFR